MPRRGASQTLAERFAQIEPMLLGTAAAPSNKKDATFSIKKDGWRLLSCADSSGVRLKTRQGANATRWFPEVVSSLERVADLGLILDGEVCVLDDLGRSDFDRLHRRALKRRYDPAEPVVYCVFDIMASHGRDVMNKQLVERLDLLDALRGLPGILVVDVVRGHGAELWQYVLKLGLEGLVEKKLTSTYQPGVRSDDWLKIKRPGAVPPQRFKRSRDTS